MGPARSQLEVALGRTPGLLDGLQELGDQSHGLSVRPEGLRAVPDHCWSITEMTVFVWVRVGGYCSKGQ